MEQEITSHSNKYTADSSALHSKVKAAEGEPTWHLNRLGFLICLERQALPVIAVPSGSPGAGPKRHLRHSSHGMAWKSHHLEPWTHRPQMPTPDSNARPDAVCQGCQPWHNQPKLNAGIGSPTELGPAMGVRIQTPWRDINH